MKKILCLLILLSFSFNVLAEDKFIKAKAHFTKKDGDSIALIEKELFFEVFLKVIDKKLKELHLNSTLFWSKYNESLEEKYTILDESLKVKYKITDESTSRELKRYNKVFRLKKLALRRKHHRLQNLITSYANQKISKSPRNPNIRIIKLEAKANERSLTKFYYKMIKGKTESEFGNLYIKTNYEFINFDVSEIGVDNESKITSAVDSNWLKWFIQTKSMNIGHIELLNEEKEKQLNEFLKAQSTNLEVPSSDFKNSLLLDIDIKVNKKEFISEFKQYVFEYSGAAYLKEIETGRVIGTYDFSKDKKRYQITKLMSLSNIIANHVFKMANMYFPNMNQKIKEVTPNVSAHLFSIVNYNNISVVYKMMEGIRNRGIQFTMQPKIISLNSQKAKIKVFFEGGKDQLVSVLEGMKVGSEGTNFTLIDTDGELSIKLN